MNGIFCSLEWAWRVSKKSKIDVSVPWGTGDAVHANHEPLLDLRRFKEPEGSPRRKKVEFW
jgi:hypothetical protein